MIPIHLGLTSTSLTNFENYPIGDLMRCQEVIPSISDMPRSVNDNYSDSDSLFEYGPVSPLVARHCEETDFDTDSKYNSDGTAATADSITCSWDMIENEMEKS